MARVKIEYNSYAGSKLATFLSFIGGTLSTLCMLPGIFLFAAGVMQLFTGGFLEGETWAMLGASILMCVVCFFISALLRWIFEALASAVAKLKKR